MIRLLPIIALSGCAGFMEVLSDPAVQQGLQRTAESAATGNLVGTLWGLGATVAAVVGYKHVKKKRANA